MSANAAECGRRSSTCQGGFGRRCGRRRAGGRGTGFRKKVDEAEARSLARIELGRKLRKARGSRTQTWVAARMATTESIVRRVESGADVRLSTLEKFAEALGMELRVSLR